MTGSNPPDGGVGPPSPSAPAGLILAGGASVRFGGTDKAFARFHGTPLIRHVAEGISPVVDRLLVSCRREQASRIREVLANAPVPVEIVVDENLVGPLGGMRDGFVRSDPGWTVVVGCDVPLVDGQLLGALSPRPDVDAVVPKLPDGHVQPLCARYRTEPARDVARSLLENGEKRCMELPARLDALAVDVETLPFDATRRLRNVNTRADLDRLPVPTSDPVP